MYQALETGDRRNLRSIKPENMNVNENYLGLDLSTQSLKAVILDENLNVVQEAGINFDNDLPEFHTSGGANQDEHNPKIVTAQPIMWVKAIDLVLEKLKNEGAHFFKIVGISGAGQQHGSIYWKKGTVKILNNLNPTKLLHEELRGVFSILNSPIWMDSSTGEYCTKLEKAVGGPAALSKLTGSRAYERFTGSQISKIFHTKREAYNETERISLVSSFVCSIFLGNYANIDYSDGSGMNLLNIRTKTWEESCVVAATDQNSNLVDKLGTPVATESVQGFISSYFVERYGFNSKCKIVTFTGDNPSSFAGMCLGPNSLAVSLGTSDTLFLSMEELPDTGFIEGHILANPISSENGFMALLCFKNGSLTRERIKKDSAGGSWNAFNRLLDSTPRGNFGNVGFYYDFQEIIPKVNAGDHRFSREGSKLKRFSSNEFEVRAVIEGQFLAKRVHAERIGCKISKDTQILATGGASSNHAILQVLSDVFNAPVYIQETSHSADIGACYRVKHAILEKPALFTNVIKKTQSFHKVCDPNSDAVEIYNSMVKRYAILEESIQ